MVGYLVKTKNTGTIIAAGKPNETPGVQTDSSWADDPWRRTSTLGMMISLDNTILECASAVDKSIAITSAEAEYRAASLGVQRVLYWRNFLLELGWKVRGASRLLVDNEACEANIKNNVEKNLGTFAKHIAIAYHNIRNECSLGTI